MVLQGVDDVPQFNRSPVKDIWVVFSLGLVYEAAMNFRIQVSV